MSLDEELGRDAVFQELRGMRAFHYPEQFFYFYFLTYGVLNIVYSQPPAG